MYKKKNLLPVIALVCAVIALILSVIAILPGGPGPDQSYENPALEQQVQALQAQVDALTAQLERVDTVQGLADWNLAAAAWADGSGADVTLSVLPEAYNDGMKLVFRVLLDGSEVAVQDCANEGGVFTATVSLPAADGYGYYCELVSPDGNRRQFPLTSPENPTDEHLVYLQSSLNAYCVMTVESWEEADGEILITSGQIEVQLPLIGTAEDAPISRIQLVMTCGGSELSRVDLEEIPVPTDGRAVMKVSDIRFPAPELKSDEYLELTLEVTLSGGQTITAPGAGWFLSGDGLSIVVG